MKRVPLMRVGMAAGMYLFLMWGYFVLPSAQWFAIFLALLMSTMLVFWVNEANYEQKLKQLTESLSDLQNETPGSTEPSDQVSLEASLIRLDTLKTELMSQYAQLGKDQAEINRNGLGSWQKGNRSH